MATAAKPISKVQPITGRDETIARLSSRAMLVNLSVPVWTARKHDKRISREVAEQHGAKSSDIGRYNKQLIAKSALKKLTTLQSRARVAHYEMTLPWMDDGARILSSELYFDYMTQVSAIREEFFQAVEEFCENYEAYRDQHMLEAGELIDPAEYPSVEKIRAKFDFSITVLPMPAAADFRVALADDERERVREQLETSIQATMHAAMFDCWQRLHKGVKHMADRLDTYCVTEDGTAHPFRDTLVSNVRELCDLLPRLNVAGDPALNRMASEVVDRLTAVPAQTLRDDAAVRAQTADAAREILRRVSDYMGAY